MQSRPFIISTPCVQKKISYGTERAHYEQKIMFCLCASHLANACQSTYAYRSCGGRHNTLLHVDAKNVMNKKNSS